MAEDYRKVSKLREWILPDRAKSWAEPTSRVLVIGVGIGMGIVAFAVTELMHYMLVPDLGRSDERLLAEGLSALVVSCLTAKLIYLSRERHRLIIARMQVIAEMNHHIRNALSPVWLSADATEDQHLNRVISEAVDRIDWALREVLPRETPLEDEQRTKMGYFQRQE